MRTKKWLLKRLLKNILAPCVLKVTHLYLTHGFSIENFQSKNDLAENQIESTTDIEEKIGSSDKTDIEIEPVEKLVCEPSLFD